MRFLLVAFVFLNCPNTVNYLNTERRGFGSRTVQMAAARTINKALFQNQTAFVLGYTGEVGSELTRILLEKKIFGNLVLIGRREVDFSDKGDLYTSGVVQKTVDFENIENHKDAFSGCTVGFCCMGTTRGKSGAAGFVKVDHDYVVNSAKVAKEVGCTNFNLVSSSGANANSMLLYMSTKGKVENEISDLKFPAYSVLRPGGLLCKDGRKEQRLGEKIAMGFLKPVSAIAPTWLTVPVEYVAKAMILNLFTRNPEKEGIMEILENRQIHEVGKEFDQHFQ